jgi:Tfp pilus assembly protein PilV
MNITITKKTGYSLVEVSISVFVLAIGVCSLLSIFPVAMQWGSDAMAGNTGSLAAKTALTYLQDESSIPATKGYEVGDSKKGGYYVFVTTSNSGVPTTGIYEATFQVYSTDFTALAAKPAASVKKNVLATFKTYIY